VECPDPPLLAGAVQHQRLGGVPLRIASGVAGVPPGHQGVEQPVDGRRQFAERGYADTPVRLLASIAGVALQTVYATYGSKAGVLALTGTEVCDNLVRRAGWTYDEYEDWLAATLVTLLLPARPARRTGAHA
jgi:hypothetical protein